MLNLLSTIVNNEGLANVLLPAVAVIFVLLAGFKSVKLIGLQKYFHSAMILVPLYKNRSLSLFFAVICFIAFGGAVALAVLVGYFAVTVSFAVIAFSSAILFAVASSVRYAIVDAGVLVPYRFIAWHELYDYYLDDGTIIFSGDRHGRQTLSSTTFRLGYNVQDEHKLELILRQNKVKHKREHS